MPDRHSPAVTMYSTPWCGYCVRLKGQLARAGIPFDVVDIGEDPTAERVVKRINDGSATVPTLVFPDGSTATNPGIGEVRARLAATA